MNNTIRTRQQILRAILRKLLADVAISVQRVQGGQVKYRRIHPCQALALLYAPPMKAVVQGTRHVSERMASWSGRREKPHIKDSSMVMI